MIERVLDLLQTLPDSLHDEVKSRWYKWIVSDGALSVYSVYLLKYLDSFKTKEDPIIAIYNDIMGQLDRENQIGSYINVLQVSVFKKSLVNGFCFTAEVGNLRSLKSY